MRDKLNREIPFVNAVFQVLEGNAKIEDAIHLLQAAEQHNNIKIVHAKFEELDLPDAPEELYEELIEGNFYSFLSETHLLLSPSWQYDSYSLLLPGGYTWTATNRAWGQTLATWANSAAWAGRDDWDYVAFYGGYTLDIIESYEQWQEVALKVIHMKWQQ